jgi:hypothetical protein
MTSEVSATTRDLPATELEAELEVPMTLGPNGPAMAAILAASFGVFSLGLLTTLSEAAVGVHDWLIFQQRVGPLSGKTTVAGVAWLVSWGILHLVWQKRDVPFVAVIALRTLLLVIGNLLMVPTIFQQFAVE